MLSPPALENIAASNKLKGDGVHTRASVLLCLLPQAVQQLMYLLTNAAKCNGLQWHHNLVFHQWKNRARLRCACHSSVKT